MVLNINLTKCNGCRNCIDVCSVHALAIEKGKCKLVKPEKCFDCGICVFACPRNALGLI